MRPSLQKCGREKKNLVENKKKRPSLQKCGREKKNLVENKKKKQSSLQKSGRADVESYFYSVYHAAHAHAAAAAVMSRQDGS